MRQETMERRERGTGQAKDFEPELELGLPEAQAIAHMSF